MGKRLHKLAIPRAINSVLKDRLEVHRAASQTPDSKTGLAAMHMAGMQFVQLAASKLILTDMSPGKALTEIDVAYAQAILEGLCMHACLDQHTPLTLALWNIGNLKWSTLKANMSAVNLAEDRLSMVGDAISSNCRIVR